MKHQERNSHEQKKSRRKHPRYPEKRSDHWSNREVGNFLLAGLFTVCLCTSQLMGFAFSLRQEAIADHQAEADRQPYYQNFIRNFKDSLSDALEQITGQEQPDAPDQSTAPTDPSGQTPAVPSGSDQEVDISHFANDTGVGGKLYAMRKEYPQVQTILAHYDEIPAKLLSLAQRNPDSMDFVAQYPALHDQPQTVDLSKEAHADTVPLLMQWDTRWGYSEYGSSPIGLTGCGPTCVTMVALFVTHDETLNPAEVANWADDHNYYVDSIGSSWTLMSEGTAHFGLHAEELNLSESKMVARLEQGQPIICAMGPGDFTRTGHFIVITGYEDGAFHVNDPNSTVNSSRMWTFKQLEHQIRNLWAFTPAQP